MFFNEKAKLVTLPVSKIYPNPSQPRKTFSEGELTALALSIRENGLLQPITVRKVNGEYYLIAGERRLRACQMAGVKEIYCILSNYNDEESAVFAILENIQRKDLNMFEQANAIINLMRNWQITQEETAKRLGISQSYLANKIRLLKLTPGEQEEILKNGLTERHARALLRIRDVSLREKILSIVIEKKFNVSQTEELISAGMDKLEKVNKIKPKRTFIAKDIRLFINTIDHAVDAMKTAGIEAMSERTETDEYIECTVRIPKLKRVQV